MGSVERGGDCQGGMKVPRGFGDDVMWLMGWSSGFGDLGRVCVIGTGRKMEDVVIGVTDVAIFELSSKGMI